MSVLRAHGSGKTVGENPRVWGQLDHSLPALAAHLLETIIGTVNLGAKKREKAKEKRKKKEKTQPRKMGCYSHLGSEVTTFSGLVLKQDWLVGMPGIRKTVAGMVWGAVNSACVVQGWSRGSPRIPFYN